VIAFVWEPHYRTGGGVLVRHKVPELPPSLVMLDERHTSQRYRGGRSKKHRNRIDHRTRTIRLVGVRWQSERPPEYYGDTSRDAIVYALPEEHLDFRDDMRRQFREALTSRPVRLRP
jgi:hypothetical protein